MIVSFQLTHSIKRLNFWILIIVCFGSSAKTYKQIQRIIITFAYSGVEITIQLDNITTSQHILRINGAIILQEFKTACCK